jgi:hypothetical protein
MSQQIDADGTTDQEARPGRPDRPVHERRVAAKLVSGPDTTCPGRQALFLHVYPVDSSTGAQPHAVRTLNLSALSSDTLAAVRRMSDDGASLFRTGQFGSVKAQCSQLLYRANGYLSRRLLALAGKERRGHRRPRKALP